MPKTKTGEVITWGEFLSRWKLGIESISQLQQVSMQVRFTWLTIIGLLCGVVISIIGILKLWWLLIILLAGLGNTVIQLIGLWQKKVLLKRMEDSINNALKGGKNV